MKKKIQLALAVLVFGAMPLCATAQLKSQSGDVSLHPSSQEQTVVLDHELIKALAKAANVPDEAVPELIDQQGAVAEFVQHLSNEQREQFAGVWIDDSFEVHVSATDRELLDYAEERLGEIKVHRVDYSYSELEDVQNRVSGVIEEHLVEDAAYVALNIPDNKVSVVIPEDIAHSIIGETSEGYQSSTGSDLRGVNSLKQELEDYHNIDLSLVDLRLGNADYITDKNKEIIPSSEYVPRIIPYQVRRPGCEDRKHCYPYIRSGMTIYVEGNTCTSGFVARNRKNQTYILTAGHCGEGGARVWTGDINWKHPWARQIGIMTNSVDESITDSARIIVNSDWKRTYWQRMHASAQAMQITGKLSQVGSKGQLICQSGTASGFACGRVVDEKAKVILYGGPKGQIARYDFWTSTMPAEFGDSGGGVFVPYSASRNASKAYGLIGGFVRIPGGPTIRSGGPGIDNVLQHQNLSLVYRQK